MATLSEKEARDVVKDMLPTIRKGIKEHTETNIYIADIERTYDTVRREGNTPDVFCKIAGAAFEHGISTNLITRIDRMAMTFRTADSKYKAPSPKACETRWKDMKKISKTRPKTKNIKIRFENPEDYWD